MVTCDIPLKSNFHTSSMTSGPLLPFLKCLLLDSIIISSFIISLQLTCSDVELEDRGQKKRRQKNNMKKRIREEKYEVQDSKWWTTEEFEETEGKGEKLANLKLCWNLCRHISRNIYTSPSHMSKNHCHFTALNHFCVFLHMTPHSTSTEYCLSSNKLE